MKTNAIEKQATAVPVNPIQAAVENAPSRPALTAAQAKLRDLGKQKDAIEAEIKSLRSRLDQKGSLTERAKQFLGGKPFRNDTESLAKAEDQRKLVDEAIAILAGEIDTLRSKFTFEMRTAVKPERQKLVTRISGLLGELRQASDEDAAFLKELADTGLDPRLLTSAAFMPVANGGGDSDEYWKRARKQEGFIA